MNGRHDCQHWPDCKCGGHCECEPDITTDPVFVRLLWLNTFVLWAAVAFGVLSLFYFAFMKATEAV